MNTFWIVFGEFVAVVVAMVALVVVARSVIVIGPAQVGLVVKRFSHHHNTTDTPIAFDGEAGYQSALLMPGVRFKLWPRYTIAKHPWVQVPAGEIGVVISQIGERLPTGAKSAVYRPEFANFTNLRGFLENGGQKGVQRPVLPPGSLVPIHPVAFLVVTATKTYGLPINRTVMAAGPLTPESIGLQHDPLLYGAYLLNPFLVRVEPARMLVVNQGEVAVIKSYVGLPTLDTSGPEFKFGSIVQPGHRGIWREALRTGKYPLNPRIYAAEKVPTFILTLNWAEASSVAHNLDAQLSPIEGKSREGFIFKIDLQVQIHVPDTKAPKVISMVGSMQNLVNEVLQAAVGNHFRNTLQALEAVRFIETRDQVQAAALEAISRYLSAYEVETRGVYIQDVAFPQELVSVLTRREIANQEKATFEQ